MELAYANRPFLLVHAWLTFSIGVAYVQQSVLGRPGQGGQSGQSAAEAVDVGGGGTGGAAAVPADAAVEDSLRHQYKSVPGEGVKQAGSDE